MRYSSVPPNVDPATPSEPASTDAPGHHTPASAERAIPVIPEAMQRLIVELYARLDRVDHYRLLGVSATADTKAIKRAYFALAKDFHPDRWFRKDIGALRGKLEAIFHAITAAEEALTSSARRAEYDAYLREVLKTRLDRRRAEALEAANDWAGAAEIWARVVEQLPTDAFVQHRYARALLRARSRHEAAVAAATRAVELDSTRAEYRFTAACLALAEGRDRSALAQLAIACELEPERTDLVGLRAALAERVARAR